MRLRTIIALGALAGVGVATTTMHSCRNQEEHIPLVKTVGPGGLGGIGGKEPDVKFQRLFTFDPKTLLLTLPDDDTVRKTLQQEGLRGKIIEITLESFKLRVKRYNAAVVASDRLIGVGPIDLRNTGQKFIPPFPPDEHNHFPVLFGSPLIIDAHGNMQPPVKGRITFNFGKTALIDSLEGNVVRDRLKLELQDDTGETYDFVVPIERPIVLIERDENRRPLTIYHIDVNKPTRPNADKDE